MPRRKPQSFQSNPIILMPGEQLTGWPTPFATPWPTPSPTRASATAYEVKASPVLLAHNAASRAAMKAWLIQSVIPLVGEDAARDLEPLIKIGDTEWDKFLDEAIDFQQSP